MKSSGSDFQYFVKPRSTGDKVTRFMTVSLAFLTLCTTGLYVYNTMLRNPASSPSEGPEIRITLLDGPVVGYIKEWAGTRQRTQARQYIRTVAVLDQCGVMYWFARNDYEKANAETYAVLKTRIVDPANQIEMSEAEEGSVVQLDANMFSLGLETEVGETEKAEIIKRAKTLEDPYPEEAFERRPSNGECDRVKVMVKAGDLVVRI